jgi:hypothetical protein
MDDASSALRQRLDRIERELRWWRRVGSLALGLMAILTLVSAAPSKPPDQIRAKRFVVVDKKGRSLAELYGSESLSSSAHPVLAMYGAKGRTAVELGVFVGEMPRLAFWDKQGVPRGTFFVGGETGGGMIVRDEKGTERAILDTAGLEVRDEQGRKGVVSATALHLHREQHKWGRVELDATGLRLRDERNSDRVVVGTTKLDELRTGVTRERSLSSLMLLDRDGKVAWKAP